MAADARARELIYAAGVDPAVLRDELQVAHDAFVSTGALPSRVRPVVADSWLRSLSEGVDPETSAAPIELDSYLLAELRARHPLSAVLPVVRRLLIEPAVDAGFVVAISDAAGRLLWVEGAPAMRARAENISFMAGTNWSEGAVGTNAPGTALALDRAVRIFGAEHLSRPITPWSCSAAPIHDPDTGAVLGVLDLTGGAEVASASSLALVRATAAAVEAELRIGRLLPAPLLVSGWSPATGSLTVLGERAAELRIGATVTRLSPRHSEILLLLATATDGLSATELAVRLSEREHADVTIRAELSRLRGLLAPLTMRSRPYRVQGLTVDAEAVREAARRGEVRAAVAAYRGPALPHSDAPGVVAWREELHHELRHTLLASRDPDALLTFADTDHGRLDLELWTAALRALPPGSPRLAQVRAHVELLGRDLG